MKPSNRNRRLPCSVRNTSRTQSLSRSQIGLDDNRHTHLLSERTEGIFSLDIPSHRTHQTRVFVRAQASPKGHYGICEQRIRTILTSNFGRRIFLSSLSEANSCEFARKGTKSSHLHRKLLIIEDLMAEHAGFEVFVPFFSTLKSLLAQSKFRHRMEIGVRSRPQAVNKNCQHKCHFIHSSSSFSPQCDNFPGLRRDRSDRCRVCLPQLLQHPSVVDR